MKITLQQAEERAEFEVSHDGDEVRVVRDGEETAVFRLIHADPPAYTMERLFPDGRRERVRLVGMAEGDSRRAWINGRSVQYTRPRKTAAGGGAVAAGSLSASIPAVVSQVLVSEGDEVTAGQKLILLESMKMVIPIQSPYAGVVTAVNCAEGDAVQPGVPLIEVDQE